MVEQAATTSPVRRWSPGLAVKVVLSLVLVVAIFWYLLKGIDLGQVRAEITSMTWLELATLTAIALWNLMTYAFVWMSVTPGLSFWRAMTMTQSTTAVANTVPVVGAPIGVGMTYGSAASGWPSGSGCWQAGPPPGCCGWLVAGR